MLSQREIHHIFEQLRKGLVPERGLDAYAVGIDKYRGEIRRQLELVEGGDGSVKFLRGGYGCGKTFMSRLAILDAQERGFVTSFVVVSDNDLRFHRFEEIYRKVVTELGTKSCPRGALGDILDRWIGGIEDELVQLGADDEAPDFDDRVRAKLDEKLASLTGGKVPNEFVTVVQTIFDLKQQGETSDAAQLLSWLSGSSNIAASIKKLAGIKGDIGSRDAMAYLRGVLEIAKAAGHKGMLIVIDEAETIMRMPRKDSRHKSLNGIRQISDACGDYPGLLWLFTGTPEFFDSKRGVAGLPPLDDRIRFITQGGFASLRQPQLELKPFDAQRLKGVAMRLRELYPADEDLIADRVTDDFIDRLVAEVTEGLRGDVGVVPRQFLRQFVNVLDLVQENEDYVPAKAYQFEARELTPEEEAAMAGTRPEPAVEEDDEFVPEEQVW